MTGNIIIIVTNERVFNPLVSVVSAFKSSLSSLSHASTSDDRILMGVVVSFDIIIVIRLIYITNQWTDLWIVAAVFRTYLIRRFLPSTLATVQRLAFRTTQFLTAPLRLYR